MPSDGGELNIRQIEAGDKLPSLKLGHEQFTPLKNFLKKDALEYQRHSLARTYGIFPIQGESEGRLAGYITLVCGVVEIGKGDEPLVNHNGLNYRHSHYPAVKIARLAVDIRFQKRGVGQHLIQLALGTAKDVVCPAVGCRFVVVDAKKPAVSFYERCGFTLLDTSENRKRPSPVMFVDLSKISAS